MTADTDASHLIVQAGGESYALPLSEVREVMKMQRTTPVPGVPQYVLGVMNMRGEVVAVVDLRTLFSLDHSRDVQRIVVISDDVHTLALAVEGTGDATAISRQDLQEPPATIDEQVAPFIDGVAVLNEHAVGVVDVTKLIKAKREEVAAGESVQGEA